MYERGLPAVVSGYPRLPIRRPLSLHVNGDEGPAQFYFRWAVATENRRRCRICVPAVAGFEAVCRKRKYNDWIGLDWIGLDWIGLDWIGLDWIAWRYERPKGRRSVISWKSKFLTMSFCQEFV
nr:MAG TPA: hypothetical protein [Caudoviricetes sp.]